jgi:hypothetical protein
MKQLTKVIFSKVFFFFQQLFGMEFRGFFSSKNGSEWNSEVFLIQKWFGTQLRWFFREMVRNGISRVFLFREMVGNKIPRVFSSEKWLGTEFRGFFSSKKWFGTEFRGFLFCETGGILTELLSVPSCSAFRGIICCQKMATLIHEES